MEQHYKLNRLRELADNDQDFINALAQTFLEEVPADAKMLEEAVTSKNYLQTYQTAHKMKPTIDMFELGILEDLIEIQDWGKFEKRDEDVSDKLVKVLTAIEKASVEISSDFSL